MFRYPGGKTRLSSKILQFLNPLLTKHDSYHEPFVGSGVLAVKIAETFPNKLIYVNDLNDNIYCFWKVISDHSIDINLLIKKIEIPPTVEWFAYLRSTEPVTTIDKAYYSIFFNRCTFSGIEMSGPIGGYKQTSKWKIDCRYNVDRICKSILYYRELFKGRLKVFNLHFREYFEMHKDGCFYIDPPYFDKGKQLYRVFMIEKEHEYLHEMLQDIDNWVLSYDNCLQIRSLYKENKFYFLDTRYCIEGKKDNWKESKELLILKK